MKHLYFYILLVLNFQTISGQACSSDTTQCSDGEICRNNVCEDASCDSSSDTTQCSEDEICRNNVCEKALECEVSSVNGNNPCTATPGLQCVSDYCHPAPCTSTGQCVHGHVCSHDTPRGCVYPVVVNVQEGSEFKLAFKEPGTPGSYEEIHWYKGGRGNTNRAALIDPIITGNEILYYNEFCSEKSPCDTSDRAHLNTVTGELTIHKVKFSDEGFYHYKFFNNSGPADTGNKYEYKLNVYVTGDLTIQGVPSEHIKVGTNLTLTCTVDTFRPKPLGVYWVIDGRNITGNITTSIDDVDGVFNLTSDYTHSVTKEDEKIECVVEPVYGDPVSVWRKINPGYGPSGPPILEASLEEQYEKGDVTLTCEKPRQAGNPSCNMFLWEREGKKQTETGSTYKFTVDKPFTKNDSSYGNFTCVCRNEFGNSSDSNTLEITILPGPLPESLAPGGGGGGGGNVALIGGAIGGILFIVLIIIIVVFITRRKNKPKAAPDDGPKQLVQNGVQPEPVYAQPNKSRKLRPQRGLDEGPQYANTGQLQGENPYENTGVDNNNPPTKQNGIMPPELIYIEVDVGKKDAKANGNKPVPKERSSMRKPKINRSDDPTMYAEIQPKA